MATEIKYERIQTVSVLYDGSAEQSLEGECSFPEYMPEIQRIVKCFALPKVVQKLATGTRATAEGFVNVTVLYESSDMSLHSITQKLPFSKQVELASAVSEGSSVATGARIQYFNCRASGARRVEFRGALMLEFCVMAQHTRQTAVSAEGEGVRVLNEKIGVVAVSGGAGKRFATEDVFPYSEQFETLFCDGTATIGQVSFSDGTVSVSGTAEVFALLSTERELCERSWSLPFHQIVDTSSMVGDGAFAIAEARVQTVSVEYVGGETGGAAVSVSGSVDAAVYEQTDLSVAVDAYSTKHTSSAETAVIRYLSGSEMLNTPFSGSVSFDVPAAGKMNAAFALPSRVYSTDSRTVVAATLYCLFESERGYECTEHPFECVLSENAYSEWDVREWTPQFKNANAEYSAGTVRLSYSGEVVGTSNIYEKAEVLDSIAVDTATEKTFGGSLCIYYADAGERIWDIAKAHNTSPDAISEENRLNSAIVSERTMLLIPIVR